MYGIFFKSTVEMQTHQDSTASRLIVSMGQHFMYVSPTYTISSLMLDLGKAETVAALGIGPEPYRHIRASLRAALWNLAAMAVGYLVLVILADSYWMPLKVRAVPPDETLTAKS